MAVSRMSSPQAVERLVFARQRLGVERVEGVLATDLLGQRVQAQLQALTAILLPRVTHHLLKTVDGRHAEVSMLELVGSGNGGGFVAPVSRAPVRRASLHTNRALDGR